MNEAEADELRSACAGLLYPSESDSPLEYFSWGKQSRELTEDGVRRLTGHAADAPVEQVPLAEFFAPVTAEQDWYRAAEKASAARFRALAELLERSLAALRVYRVGATEIDAYIVGRSTDGEWAGLKTKLVET